MAHVIEPATSGRAKCRGCGKPIAQGDLRFGERLPNPFSTGEMTQWFHPPCAAFKRPEPFLEALQATAASLEDRARLESEANRGVSHRRLPRVTGADRAPTGRARCRSCREPIAKGSWRVLLVYYEDGRFAPSGSIHIRCARAYLETTEIIERLRYFSPGLSDADVAEIRGEMEEPG